MRLTVDTEKLRYALDKNASAAVWDGKNRAYGKGMRDAINVVLLNGVCLDEAIEMKKGGVPRLGTWWYECGRCGQTVDAGDQYCRQCGIPLKKTEEDKR